MQLEMKVGQQTCSVMTVLGVSTSNVKNGTMIMERVVTVDQDANNYGELAYCTYDVATCDDVNACNYNTPGDCTYAEEDLTVQVM